MEFTVMLVALTSILLAATAYGAWEIYVAGDIRLFRRRLGYVALLALVAGFSIWLAISYPHIRFANEFGPDWDCEKIPMAGSICVQDVRPKSPGGD